MVGGRCVSGGGRRCVSGGGGVCEWWGEEEVCERWGGGGV